MDEQHAFITAYDRYSDAIFRHCFFRLYDRERAKDLMQETFAKTWEYLAQGNEVENLRAFLYRVANNLIIDETRRKPAESLDALTEAGQEPHYDSQPGMLERADYSRIFDALRQVPEPYRQAVTLRYVDGMPPREIAKLLQETDTAISVRIHRGVQQLKAILHRHV